MSDHEAPRTPSDKNVDGVVDSANEALADADRAAKDAASDGSSIVEESEVIETTNVETPKVEDPDAAAFAEAESAFPGTFGTSSAAAAPASESIAADAYTPPPASDADTRIFAPEPAAEPTVTGAAAPGPIFVQAPEPPRDRGNRGTVAGIGILAALCFAVLYLGTALGIGALAGNVEGDTFVDSVLEALTSWQLWVPTAVFFIAFWLLGAIINRGRWGFWVVFGILVGVASYGGHLLGQLFAAPFWNISSAQAGELVNVNLLAPLAIAAFIFGRELTIWFGAWAARSGARKTVRNAEAQREYERLLEAGPKLSA
ncbi:hypothetical protein GCM10025768_06800 [Microbacterium pseudoresistens]|uniref:Uncharacterized protein n=1 Tax=Microbacterium pseudoresistens TaxID=640634 RepID=A0A7Y9JM89_9MICO|nr:ABC transporter [Microbacterium pseudoresistens]NYD54517.1 hypothetical protein [Microbacterium pseudoresistens]